MKKKYSAQVLAFYMLCFIAASACKNNGDGSVQVKDHGLGIFIRKAPNRDDAGTAVNYSARLVPDKELLGPDEQILRTKMWYSNDSCFYLQAGPKKIYADLVQPIANGVPGSFEYFLSFNTNGITYDNCKLIYRDKFMNRRTYSIALSNQ